MKVFLVRESLVGKVVAVTGGGSGIGGGIVERLNSAGALCHAIGRRGPVKLDVSDQPAVQHFVESLERLDILVCAAGDNMPRRRLAEITPDAWNHLISVNLSGAFYFVNAGLDKLRSAQGDVVLIGSIAGRWPDMSGPAYAASKAGLSAFAATAGFEEHVNGVRSAFNDLATRTIGPISTPVLIFVVVAAAATPTRLGCQAYPSTGRGSSSTSCRAWPRGSPPSSSTRGWRRATPIRASGSSSTSSWPCWSASGTRSTTKPNPHGSAPPMFGEGSPPFRSAARLRPTACELVDHRPIFRCCLRNGGSRRLGS